jgi:hypothetical protein
MKLSLVLFALAIPALAADNSITGTWQVETDIMGNQGSMVCTLKQDGDKISGNCALGDTDQEVTGEVKNQTVTWKHGGDYNGQALTITYSGTFQSASSIAGDVNVQPFEASGTFTAKKKGKE